MRILHVTNTYLPVRNGVTVSVAGWVDALRQAGHDVAVWTIACGQGGREGDVYSVRGSGSLADGFPIPLTLSPPLDLVRRAWDVVHVHHPVLLGSSAARFAERAGLPLAATAHSDYVAYLDSYATKWAGLLRPLAVDRLGRFFNRAEFVLAPSKGIADALFSWGVRAPVGSMSYPVDLASFRPCPRKEARAVLGIGESVPLAVYAGRLAAEKRVFSLLEEFAVARRAVPEARLAIVGTGPLDRAVREAAAKHDGHVIVTGSLPPAELGRWYCAADVFVSASRNEVGPLTTIEAGLCGTPTVAMRAPGFSDRVESGVTGLLVQPDRGALAAGLADLLGNRERAHVMGEASARSLSGHTPEASVRTLMHAYEAAIHSKEHALQHERSRRPRLKTDAE